MGFLPSGFLKRHSSKSRPHDRAKATRRRDSGLHRQLRFEPLEDRCLLAALGLTIQLYQDTISGGNHVPGALINPQTNPIQVGQSFFVEVVAEDANDPNDASDLSRTPVGVISLPLNLSWNANVIQYADTLPTAAELASAIPPPSAGAPFSQWVTGNFPLQRAVASLDPSNATAATFNGINGLGGAAIPNSTPPQGSAITARWPASLRRESSASCVSRPWARRIRCRSPSTWPVPCRSPMQTP